MKTQITFTAKLPIKMVRKESWVVAACPALDVASQGENEEIARKNLGEALLMFLRSCYERGTLDAVLKDCGFEPALMPTTDVAPSEDYIDVPLHLLSKFEENHQCHRA